MRSFIRVTSHNVSRDKRERQWVNAVLFNRVGLNWNKGALPMYEPFFTYWNHPTGNRVFALFSGRLSVIVAHGFKKWSI